MPHTVPANEYPTGIFKQLTPDETQELKDGPTFNSCWKGYETRSHIYERLMPDKLTGTLRIDGPKQNGGFIGLQSTGAITIVTGEKNVELGPSSGKLCIHTHGQQQLHEGRTDIEYNDGGPESDGEALNINAYCVVNDEEIGYQRTIKAQKIFISAEEELVLVGKGGVTIQAGVSGGATISMKAGQIEKYTDNLKEVIIGQRMTFGVSEQTAMQFDPRSSVNVVSSGHINHKILGDYSQWVGGVSQTIIAGGPALPPLVEARDSTFSVKTAIGGQTFDAAGFINRKAGAAIADVAGASFSATAGVDASISAGANTTVKAGGILNLTAIGNTNIKGAIINLN